MQGTPNFAITPHTSGGVLSTGDTSHTAPSSVAILFTAGPSGSRIERVTWCAQGPINAVTTSRLFLYNGSTYFQYAEIGVPISANPVSGVLPWQYTMEGVNTPNLIPILLGSGWSLRASINDTPASGITNTATGGDF